MSSTTPRSCRRPGGEGRLEIDCGVTASSAPWPRGPSATRPCSGSGPGAHGQPRRSRRRRDPADKKVGDAVESDEPLCTLLVNDESRLEEATALILEAYYHRRREPDSPRAGRWNESAYDNLDNARSGSRCECEGESRMLEMWGVVISAAVSGWHRRRRHRRSGSGTSGIQQLQTRDPKRHRQTPDRHLGARRRRSVPKPRLSPSRSPGISALARPLVLASSRVPESSTCPTSPIGSGGSSGCWRSWVSPFSCRITAGRSRAASSSGGLLLQWGFALLVLRVPAGCQFLEQAGDGGRVDPRLCPRRSRVRLRQGAGQPDGPGGFVFAFRVLPTVIFVAAPVRRALSPGRDAVGRARLRRRDGLVDGHQRRRVAQRRRLAFPGPDRGAA